ncbi:hypothetical protein F2P79_000679 [Pimephales promelas]|nr:hypothetical protein F2P79_000679 [Pimephales promelas]
MPPNPPNFLTFECVVCDCVVMWAVNGPSHFPTSLVSAREMWASVALNTEHYRQTKATLSFHHAM